MRRLGPKVRQLWSIRLLASIPWEKLLFAFESFLDSCVTHLGPLYIVLATVLILGVAIVFFFAVLPQLASVHGVLHQLAHGTWGVLLLGNVLFNYYMCVMTPPGYTESHNEDGGTLEGSASVRFCKRCSKAKPPRSHHCHICNRCVLQMDHHCPWMNNCVGFFNFRFFFLFVFYLWLGASYATAMFFGQLRAGRGSRGPVMQDNRALVVAAGVLSGAVAAALTALLSWHLFLVLTAQSTVDFFRNIEARRDARWRGELWVNPYDLGLLRNFQESFDVEGRLWWLTWMLPRSSHRKGNGMQFPRVHSSSDFKVSVLSSIL